MKDSSLALNLAVHRLHDKVYSIDFVKEIIEQASILYNSKKSGIVELGGGVPKNTAQQTGPLLDQILQRNDGGQDYVIQITDARPSTQEDYQVQHCRKEKAGARYKMHIMI